MFDKDKITIPDEVKHLFLCLCNVRNVPFYPDDSFDSYINVVPEEATFTVAERICRSHGR